LFFDKGSPTNEIWYYQHKFPEGQKSYSKTKPLLVEEFDELKQWWFDRTENDNAWKVQVSDLINWDLDIKNPKILSSEVISLPKTLKALKQNLASFSDSISLLDISISKQNNHVPYKISQLLKRIKEPFELENNVKYKRVTIKGNHNGVVLRDIELGSKIGTKNQFYIRKGNFILSKIDARNGAFGLIPDDLEGAIITGNFWTYKINMDLIDGEWFYYFTHSFNFLEICKNSSTGSTHRKYLNEDIFLSQVISVPKIEDQRLIVKKFNEINKLKNLNEEIQDLSDKLFNGFLNEYY
jgi:type I restriction enzyme M protein